MKIYVMISDDLVFKPRVLFRLLLVLGEEICGVAEVGYKGYKRKKSNKRLSQLGFWGLKDFLLVSGYSILLRLINKFPLPSYIGCKLSNKRTCDFFNVPYHYTQDVNEPEFIQCLKILSPDIIVSSQMQIFSRDLISTAQLACLNCHPAKLPKFRGLHPIFSAMLHGEDRIGITIHTMTEEIDKGHIISQREFFNKKKNSLMDNSMIAHELYPDVIIEALNEIKKRDIRSFPVVPLNSPYFKYPTREQVTLFRSNGLKMV